MSRLLEVCRLQTTVHPPGSHRPSSHNPIPPASLETLIYMRATLTPASETRGTGPSSAIWVQRTCPSVWTQEARPRQPGPQGFADTRSRSSAPCRPWSGSSGWDVSGTRWGHSALGFQRDAPQVVVPVPGTCVSGAAPPWRVKALPVWTGVSTSRGRMDAEKGTEMWREFSGGWTRGGEII